MAPTNQEKMPRYIIWLLSSLILAACQPTRLPSVLPSAAPSLAVPTATPALPPEIAAELDDQERQSLILSQDFLPPDDSSVAEIKPLDNITGQLELELAKTVPLRYQQLLGGHNAYNNKGIFKNQYWTITQQLDAGVRVLELDLHGRLLSSKVRVCHGISANTCLLNPFGVRNYQALLSEIKAWSDQHPDQLLIIELENHVKHEKSVLQPLQDTFKNVIYTSAERSPQWLDETPAQIIAKGKRIIVADFGANRYDKTLIWDENEWFTNNLSKDFQPHCQVNGKPMGEKRWGFYDDKTYRKPNPLTPANITAFLSCNTRYLKVDRLNMAILDATRFTWDPNWLPSGVSCARLSSDTKLWQPQSCETPARMACSASNDRYHWKLTTKQGPWSAGETLCQSEFGADFHFDVPRTYYQNHLLKHLLTNAGETVWLNYQTKR